MKLYIKAAEDDSNKLPVDQELEDIFHRLEDTIYNNIVSDINNRLGDEIVNKTSISKDSYLSRTYYDSKGKPYADSYMTAVCIAAQNKTQGDEAYTWFENSEIDAYVSSYFNSRQGVLVIEIHHFPLTKDFSYSKSVLKPNFVENTYEHFLDSIIYQWNKLMEYEHEEDYYEEEMSYDEWYNSDASEDDGHKFLKQAESILTEKYPGCIFEEEPSVQGYQGADFWWLTYQDNSYSIEFDWDEQMYEIYDDGPEYAAKDYANRFIKAIDSGEALEEE